MEELQNKIVFLIKQGMTPERIVNALLYKKIELQDIGKAMMKLNMDVGVVQRATGLNRTWLLTVKKQK